jgi:hypothetical protein
MSQREGNGCTLAEVKREDGKCIRILETVVFMVAARRCH